MVFYYAPGGGLGHLTRAKKVLSALGLEKFMVITAHHNIPKALFSSEQILMLPSEWAESPEKVLPWLNKYIEENKVETIFIDTFPAGLRGEICSGFNKKNIKRVYVARFLKWNDYIKAIQLEGVLNTVRFDNCIVVDDLHPEQSKFIQLQCDQIQELQIEPLEINTHTISTPIKDNTWLIAHSMPLNELTELFEYAKEVAYLEKEHPHYLVCTTIDVNSLSKEFHAEDVSVISAYPINTLFSKCKRLFTACGYNVMNETINYSDKHCFIPFHRRYDDQFLRAKNRRKVV